MFNCWFVLSNITLKQGLEKELFQIVYNFNDCNLLAASSLPRIVPTVYMYSFYLILPAHLWDYYFYYLLHLFDEWIKGVFGMELVSISGDIISILFNNYGTVF